MLANLQRSPQSLLYHVEISETFNFNVSLNNHVGWVEREPTKDHAGKTNFNFIDKPEVTKILVKPNTFSHRRCLGCWVSLYLSTRMVHRKSAFSYKLKGSWSLAAQPNLRLY